jgi:hypothetical protein
VNKYINLLNYPILDFVNLDELWSHPAFRGIYHKMDIDSCPQDVRDGIEASRKDGMIATVWTNSVKQTAKRRDKWPIFALFEEDFNKLGKELVMSTDDMVCQTWSLIFRHLKPEFVLTEMWDDAFYHVSDDYDEWLGTVERSMSGILLMEDNIVFLYHIIPTEENGKKGFYELIIGLNGRYLTNISVCARGWLSESFQLGFDDDVISRIMADRSIDYEQAVFQELGYNLLCYEYFKEKYMLQPRVYHNGDVVRCGLDGGDTVRIACDTDILIYGAKGGMS